MIGRKSQHRRPPQDRAVAYAVAWFMACLVLGGASNGGVLSNLLLQIGAALIISRAIARTDRWNILPLERPLLIMLTALLIWIGITLIPLPPALWTALPGREFVAQGYRLLGMELPWLPISLTDDRTVRSALALLVPVASYLIARRLDDSGRRRVAAGIVIVACFSVVLGLAQLLGGEQTRLRPYASTNTLSPVGLFANANHFVTFLLIAIPLTLSALRGGTARKQSKVAVWSQQYLGYGALAVCVFGVLLAGSNAGKLLLVPAILGALLLGPGRKLMERRGSVVLFGAGLGMVAGLLVLSLSSGIMADKVGTSAKSRTYMTGVTLESARVFLPVGSGLGSFPAIYLMDSGGKKSNREWTNHAHDDPAEVLLELGLPGLAMMALFAFWLTRSTLTIWGEERRGGSPNRLAQAASLGAVLIMLHSSVDYPLRTAAIGAVLAFLVTCMFEPKPPHQANGIGAGK